MITQNPMQLKAIIKKEAERKNISAQLVMQNYMLERLLERISLSQFIRYILSLFSCLIRFPIEVYKSPNSNGLHVFLIAESRIGVI